MWKSVDQEAAKAERAPGSRIRILGAHRMERGVAYLATGGGGKGSCAEGAMRQRWGDAEHAEITGS